MANLPQDSQPDSWIGRLPQALIPYAVLMRLDRPTGFWLLLLPGWAAIALADPELGRLLWLAVLFFIGAFVMRTAGCIINDLIDRRLDAEVARTANRPLASGAVSVPAAMFLTGVLMIFGLLILLELPVMTIALGVLAVLLIWMYPFMKRLTWWPQAFLGITFAWSALMGWTAGGQHLGEPVAWLFLGTVLWVLGYDTIYAHQDIEDDMRVGVKSTARLFRDMPRPFVGTCFALTGLCWAMAIWRGDGGVLGGIGLAVAAVLMVRSLDRWTPEDGPSSLTAFRRQREVGFALVAGLALNALF